METHPSYPSLSSIILKYPSHGGSLFQTYNDILLAQKWRDIEVLDLGESCKRGAICGRKPVTASDADTLLHIVPCSLAESISISWIINVFTSLSDPPSIYLAITTDDSSIVYYKISSGIVKPFV